jgi:nucleotide-binding universal stress UspA family protein
MALRDILVCLDATNASDRRRELALNLAQSDKAFLTAVYTLPELQPAPPPPAGVGLPPTILGPVSPDGASVIGGEPMPVPPAVVPVLAEAERADIAEHGFRDELARREIGGEWQTATRAELAELIGSAKAADLVVLGQYPVPGADGLAWLQPDEVMIEIGRPVLVVPPRFPFDRVGRRVLVAWDATREANRALHDALPLLGAAVTVTVMHVAPHQADLDHDRPGLERIVRHLERHGIAAEPEESLHPAVSIADALLSRAAANAADLIVAGAYHHSPLRERLIGGVSRNLLANTTVPLLMSH